MSEHARERSRAEVTFHAGLVAILLPVLGALVLWALAVHNLRHQPESVEQRRWSRRLVGLALIDTLVAISLVVASLMGMQEALAAPRGGPRIGVLLDDEGNGVAVEAVLDDSPAEAAGIEAGDRIVAAGGAPIDTTRELLDALRAGEAVTLGVERRGETMDVVVRPRHDVRAPSVVRSSGRCAAPVEPAASPWQLAPYALVLVVTLVLWVLGRRRGVRQWTFWVPFALVLLVVSMAGTLGTWLACAALDIAGTRASTAGLLLAEIVLTLVVLGWLGIARRRGIASFHDERERWSVGRTYAVALLYAMAWMPRIAVMSIPLLYAAQQAGVFEVSPLLEEVLGGAGDEAMTAVFVLLAAVVLAPIAEEVLFRGLLLPHLGRSIGAWPALYVGALVFGLLHVSHGVMLLGPLVLGAILGWARMRSRGLVAPILLHVSFNGAAVLSSWFS